MGIMTTSMHFPAILIYNHILYLMGRASISALNATVLVPFPLIIALMPVLPRFYARFPSHSNTA